MEELKKVAVSRRSFLKGATVGAVGIASMGVLGGCAPQTSESEKAPGPTEGSDWLGQAPVINDADCTETVDTEVLVVGAGCAGLFAACAAAESGAKVLLVEKNQNPNGVRSSALGAVGSKLQAQHGVNINKVDIVNDICHYALNYNDMSLVKFWADNSGETLDWYCDFIDRHGKCEVKLEYTMPGQPTRYKMWPTGHGTQLKGGGDRSTVEPTVAADMIAYVESLGGQYRNETKLECVIKEDDKVVGIYASNKEGKIRINASKGVIIATGGYAANEEMYTALQGETKKSLVGLMCFPGATGDGIKAALWAGAKFDPYHSTMIFDRGAIAPDVKHGDPYKGGRPYYHIGTQPFLKVNKAGSRICNESSPYDFIVHAAANYEDKAWYQIFDSNWREDVTRFHTIGCSTLQEWEGGNHHPEGLDAVEQAINDFIDKGLVVKANTIAEVADAMGIPAEQLQSTVDRYNELYDMGEDVDFGKDSFRLSALRQPPYYCTKLGGLMLSTMDGVQINTNSQVIGQDEKPIPGLFVVGNDSGRYYTATYPNFGAGTNAGRCATFGRYCGKYVASL
ncbi:fumarate reductase flavoprotein subunit [hydrocarbon metagenome]|uniref:Fumarate reductase flavoprotein subunit n=1 Tax=hydrocarbon metagenome TaxID=938273 RepID=A0A0W8E9Y4_9ZZZZ